MNALTPANSNAIAATTSVEFPPIAGSLLNFVASAMADPAINVDKLQMLLSMQREIVADDARLQFNRAMSAAQGEMDPVVRDATNDQTKSKWARLETIDALIRPIYTRHGFCLEFNSEAIEGPNERIVCEVSHTAGHTKRRQLEAAPDTIGPQGKPNKTPLHGLGSTVSYLRRYLTCMIFNVVLANDDNDGNRQRQRDDGLLSLAQVEELNALMVQTRTLESRFLAVMAPALKSIEEASAADFPRLKNALLTKRTTLARRAANDQTGAAA